MSGRQGAGNTETALTTGSSEEIAMAAPNTISGAGGGHPGRRLRELDKLKDWYILTACSGWRLARASLLVAWAKEDEETVFGHFDEAGDYNGMIEQIRIHKDRLSETLNVLEHNPPRTIEGVREVLRVVVEILATRAADPEGFVGGGDLLQMVRQVEGALQHVDGDTPVGQLRETTEG
jgi:hypothetical protein